MNLSYVWKWVGAVLRRREGRARIAEQAARVRRHGRAADSLVRACEPNLLSVLIPARGAEAYIGECLASILGQAPPEGMGMEVVVGIDGCEATRAAVSRQLAALPEQQAERVRMLFYPVSLGAYVMQNSLLRASRGAWVHIVGADDALAPDSLEPLCRFMKECAAVSPAFLLRPLGMECNGTLAPVSGKPPFPVKGAICFSKTVLAKLGGFAPWSCAADSDFLRRAEGKNIPAFVCPQVSYLYRQHDVQLSKKAGTALKSEIRAGYWRMTDRRIACREFRVDPVVNVPAEGEA
jgi:glycosyltransferase involved in cell wall biosynthesis